MGDAMELVFVCPVQKQVFKTAAWKISGKLEQVRGAEGRKSLQGRVEAGCPFCLEAHVFSPDELPCPFEAKKEQQSTGGGDEQ